MTSTTSEENCRVNIKQKIPYEIIGSYDFYLFICGVNGQLMKF